MLQSLGEDLVAHSDPAVKYKSSRRLFQFEKHDSDIISDPFEWRMKQQKMWMPIRPPLVARPRVAMQPVERVKGSRE
jgi:hypothetical protein